METRVFLEEIQSQELRRRIEFFYSSLTCELDTFGITLDQILRCKLLILKEESGQILGVSGVLEGNYTCVVVKKEYQNRRIGKVLFDELIKWAPEAKCNFVMGNALVSNVKINRIWMEAGGRVLYTSVLGGKKHYLQFISFNWRGMVWGRLLKLLWVTKVPNGLMHVFSRTLKVLHLG